MRFPLEVGKTYLTRMNAKVTILAVLPDGAAIGKVPSANEWSYSFYDSATGMSISPKFNITSSITSELDTGRDMFDNTFDIHQRDAVKRIVKAFIDKKITGIKILRGTYNLGLSEAKTLFEHVAGERI